MMRTREQHLAAAVRIARDNYGWAWDGNLLMHETGALVRLAGYGSTWGKLSAFRTADAAVRALGFSLATESTDAR
jgi:hypothetical protein